MLYHGTVCCVSSQAKEANNTENGAGFSSNCI